jgi:ParB-like chromosome segregation protein Spo0J
MPQNRKPSKRLILQTAMELDQWLITAGGSLLLDDVLLKYRNTSDEDLQLWIWQYHYPENEVNASNWPILKNGFGRPLDIAIEEVKDVWEMCTDSAGRLVVRYRPKSEVTNMDSITCDTFNAEEIAMPDTAASVTTPVSEGDNQPTPFSDSATRITTTDRGRNTLDIPLHAVTALFPDMSESEFEELKRDIEQHNLREPIVTYRGQVIDGRHRLRACCELGIMPITREWDGQGDLYRYVISLNLHRRHLNVSQRSVLAAQFAETLEQARSNHPLEDHGPGSVAKLPQGKRTREIAAEAFGVSPRSVQIGLKVRRDGIPALEEAVAKGRITVNTAGVLADLPSSEQEKVLAAGSPAGRKKAAELRHARTSPEGIDGKTTRLKSDTISEPVLKAKPVEESPVAPNRESSSTEKVASKLSQLSSLLVQADNLARDLTQQDLQTLVEEVLQNGLPSLKKVLAALDEEQTRRHMIKVASA